MGKGSASFQSVRGPGTEGPDGGKLSFPIPFVKQCGLVASGVEPKRSNVVLPLVDLVGVLDGSLPQFPHTFAVEQ